MTTDVSNDLALFDGGPVIDTDALPEILGWELKPEGLCRDTMCVLVPDRSQIQSDGGLNAAAVADLLDRPFAVDDITGTVAIGAPRASRRSALDLVAPDFTLNDLDDTPHRLSDHRSKKRLLVAFSSW